MLNHLQFLLLLILVNTYIPGEIIKYLTASASSMISLGFFKFENFPYLSNTYNYFEMKQESNEMEEIGFEYSSSLRTNMSLFLTFIFVLFLALIVYILSLIPINPQRCKCNKWLKGGISVIKKILIFNLFVRLLIESFTSLTLTSCIEIYSFRARKLNEEISLYFSYGILAFCLIFCFFVIFHFCKYTKSDMKLTEIFIELYTGIKEERAAKAFTQVWLMNRFLAVISLVCLQEFDPKGSTSILFLFEICYIVYMIKIRPFMLARTSIIEIVNQSFICAYLIALFSLNKSDWNSTLTDCGLMILLANNVIVFVIVFINFWRDIYSKFCKKKSSKQGLKRREKVMPKLRKEPIKPSDVSRSDMAFKAKLSKLQSNFKEKPNPSVDISNYRQKVMKRSLRSPHL
ncbi:unnamed protein product [Moneuplotes crassus]|uniref:TRP C-terminal domain-containing protein n=1 Tax=Euplotes crassus TaxID=5936 RepID=A0AAD1UQR2_EUPCR|nr:unnamed protein product [Moneuplotes crassus]